MKRDRMDDVITELLEERSTGGVQFDASDIEQEAFRAGRSMGVFNFLQEREGIDPAEWVMEVIKTKRRSHTGAKEKVKGRWVRKFHYLSSTGLWVSREALTRNQLMTVIRDYESQGQALEARKEGLYEMVSEMEALAQKLGVNADELKVGDIETGEVAVESGQAGAAA